MPRASGGTGAVEFRTDTSDFKRLFDRSSQVDKVLQRGLRRNIRQAAEIAASDVRRTVMQTPRSSGRGPHTGLRQRLAGGVKVQVMTGNTRIGVALVASAAGLPPEQKSLVRAYGRPGGWRHPVRGNTDVWVTQVGRPGWPRTTVQAHRDEMTRAVTAAMQEAADSLKGS